MIEELERGRVYFLYRPKVNLDRVGSLDDVDRVYLVLHPDDRSIYRLIALSGKTLPTKGGDRLSAYVDRVAASGAEISREFRPDTARNELPRDLQMQHYLAAIRPAGEGVYVLFRHDDHSLFSYVRELPAEAGDVQKALGILDQQVFRLTIRNPDLAPTQQPGLDDRSADFPADLAELFNGQSYLAADPPDFLNYEGAELQLVGLNVHAAEDFGIDADPEFEEPQSAEVFNDLHLSRREVPTAPLFNGRWQ
jgi:hypothetical protein